MTNNQLLLEKRREEALSVANKISKILKEEYGAKEVIIFGSVRGDSPWHWQSDLDLAVRGMSTNSLWNAYSVIEGLTPSWLKVDLVSLEGVNPEVRSRILQAKPMSNNKYLALKSLIEDEMIAIERNVEALRRLLEQAESIPEIALTPALASYINDFYKGCERISERVAVTLDGGLPRGENWHQQLLRQVADTGGENRPPLWCGSLLLELDEYRKFRHLVVHIYSVQLEQKKVLALGENVESVVGKMKEAIALFNEWLDERGVEEK
ncbi:MAG: nucleotidyltransferase domain-containing protein [Gomphosphaeria aponina SAG 52.96 = DSM 107014]|uniref:Nucleotidyltransferase domain-containing protein n=1 Tax=Gomphosphaeria aponina SAG 52.96 = DSM 107014 TaxID=1521640 RepID=A0A941GTT4_9CHRO|nr:nucleotidyltransferase domain-containing protein [Gomphosphaeria aponina SAG 52.96 = DSM 107014]